MVVESKKPVPWSMPSNCEAADHIRAGKVQVDLGIRTWRQPTVTAAESLKFVLLAAVAEAEDTVITLVLPV